MIPAIKNQHLLFGIAGLGLLCSLVSVVLLVMERSGAAERRALLESLRAQREAMTQSESRLNSRIDELAKDLAEAQTKNAAARASLKVTLDQIAAKKWLMTAGNDNGPWLGDTQSLRGQIESINNAQKKLAVELVEISKRLTPEKK